MKKYFKFDQLGTDYKKEVLGGVTTFFAMAYIVIVNPAILAIGGIPREASVTATIIAAMIGTLMMALYARRPFAIAPYMGENAFVAYTVCLGMGYEWQKALGAVFIGGVIFVTITALRIRSWITRAIPDSLKRSFAAGIGFFIMFIGLNDTGIIRLGVPGAPVKIGDLSAAGPLLAILCIIVISILMIKKIPGSLLIGMLVTTILSYFLGVARAPEAIISAPPSIAPVFLKLDIAGALTLDFIPIILVVFVLDFVDTMGTLIGVSARARLLDESGNLPEIEKPMMADAIATVTGALAGTTTTGTFIESAAGIEAGARSGFASLVTAGMFAICLFLAPLFVSVPGVAYGGALIIVGFLMLSPIEKINFEDYTELFPAAATIALMSFTFNIGFGMTAGFVLYPLFKVMAGKARELNAGVWILFAISMLLFLFYPYGKA
ncbi:MAG: guanine permease [candidate division Zixibacteria bacterium RBG_16_53_22]|nr:MAG: guanine permease [candidate division Zixibacteria bacterium RBG_16_53_22]